MPRWDVRLAESPTIDHRSDCACLMQDWGFHEGRGSGVAEMEKIGNNYNKVWFENNICFDCCSD